MRKEITYKLADGVKILGHPIYMYSDIRIFPFTNEEIQLIGNELGNKPLIYVTCWLNHLDSKPTSPEDKPYTVKVASGYAISSEDYVVGAVGEYYYTIKPFSMEWGDLIRYPNIKLFKEDKISNK